MAFDPNNPPSLIASGIGGSRGLKAWAWRGVMPIAEVIGTGYIRTARKLGMGVGDAVRYVDANNDPHYLVLSAIDADTGWGTLSFPETDPLAYPIDASPAGQIYVVAYVDDEQVRIDPTDLPAPTPTFASQAEAEAGVNTTNSMNPLRVFQAIAAYITGRAAKTPPVDADGIVITDSAASGAPKQVTWANIKAAMFTAWGALLAAATAKTTPVDADVMLLSDSAASNATKKVTWANVKATVLAALGTTIAALTGKTTPVDADTLALSDSAAAGAGKSLTWANVKATLLAYFVTAFIRFDVATALTLLQQGQARANIGADILAGQRNKIINGDFDVWQRAITQTATGYGSDDRWTNDSSGSTKVHSQQVHTLGQVLVPGNPKFYSRTVVTSVAGAGNFCYKLQKIEGVQLLSGKTVTVSFWAKADAAKNISLELVQNFGAGGSPSTQVSLPAAAKTLLSTGWTKYTVTFAVPSVSGKTLGTAGDFLGLLFWFDAGSTLNARTNTLGQQSGTFELSHVSVVEGDATAEADPFSPRHIQQELALCQRYYWRSVPSPYGDWIRSYSAGAASSQGTWKPHPQVMRTTPAGTVVGTFSVTNSAQPVFLDVSTVGYLLSAVSVAGGDTLAYSNSSGYITLDAEL